MAANEAVVVKLKEAVGNLKALVQNTSELRGLAETEAVAGDKLVDSIALCRTEVAHIMDLLCQAESAVEPE